MNILGYMNKIQYNKLYEDLYKNIDIYPRKMSINPDRPDFQKQKEILNSKFYEDLVKIQILTKSYEIIYGNYI